MELEKADRLLRGRTLEVRVVVKFARRCVEIQPVFGRLLSCFCASLSAYVRSVASVIYQPNFPGYANKSERSCKEPWLCKLQ